MFTYAIDYDDVLCAERRIRGQVVQTPLLCCEPISRSLGCEIHLKAENLQHIGAFKARGAMNAVQAMSDDQASVGVLTHSSGNHAAALARSASIRKIPVHIVMPHNSSANKVSAVRSFGVEPVFCEPSTQAREAKANELLEETGATLIHPYDNKYVMAGQGTVGLEILQQLEQVEVVVAPVGGGGLLAGMLVAIKARHPETEVIAAEPQWADDAARSLQAGSIQQPTRYDTVADGLRTSLGKLTFPIIQELVDDIVLVTEDGIRRATRCLAESANLVAEPSGAVALSAVFSQPDRFAGRRVAVVVSGGNVDFGTCTFGEPA